MVDFFHCVQNSILNFSLSDDLNSTFDKDIHQKSLICIDSQQNPSAKQKYKILQFCWVKGTFLYSNCYEAVVWLFAEHRVDNRGVFVIAE